ncbi:hypothetical protein AGR13a_Lc110064 [Agrobacterium genomosp. 13 str. CFBP 6927]|uniref:Uncharacterized protein n=1 Tax=Agrobacterium genomosp. 13 str. CFBP 6927 TaxID=1183428 RepID=A0ABM9VJ85_9HYPH|nr:hypothetical protein AGR13a_Lc110064 [Agrobacterium genomosp. 13 str. CFBP 6927]
MVRVGVFTANRVNLVITLARQLGNDVEAVRDDREVLSTREHFRDFQRGGARIEQDRVSIRNHSDNGGSNCSLFSLLPHQTRGVRRILGYLVKPDRAAVSSAKKSRLLKLDQIATSGRHRYVKTLSQGFEVNEVLLTQKLDDLGLPAFCLCRYWLDLVHVVMLLVHL